MLTSRCYVVSFFLILAFNVGTIVLLRSLGSSFGAPLGVAFATVAVATMTGTIILLLLRSKGVRLTLG